MLYPMLLVMLLSLNPDPGALQEACTEPLLSYSYDASEAGDRTMVHCFICEDRATWRLVSPEGDKSTETRAIVNIASVRDDVDRVREGRVIDSTDLGADSPTILYMAHPSEHPAFLLSGRQQDKIWTNNASITRRLVNMIDSVCGRL